jgi:hypothetical protein
MRVVCVCARGERLRHMNTGAEKDSDHKLATFEDETLQMAMPIERHNKKTQLLMRR